MSAANLKVPVCESLPGWMLNPEAATDEWRREVAPRVSCMVSQYEGTDNYFWQAARADDRLSGIARGKLTAMLQAEDTMALPIEEFNRLLAAKLIEEFQQMERDILRLSPSTDLIPGYHAGYEAGVADVKRRIAAAIDLDTEGQS